MRSLLLKKRELNARKSKLTTKEKIEIMNAFLEGKIIQWKNYGSDWRDWKGKDSEEPKWDWDNTEYRIKPKEKYIPYENTLEMVKDYCKRTDNILIGSSIPIIWIRDKNDKGAYLISAFYEKGVSLFNGQCGADLKELFNNYAYIDGSPIGKKVE